MAGGVKKISDLSSAATLDGTEVAPVVQAGSTKKLSLTSLFSWLWGKDVEILNVDADTVIASTARRVVVNVTTGASPVQVTLLDADTNPGVEITVNKVDTGSGAVTVVRAGTDYIDFDLTSVTLDSRGDVCHVQSIGSGVWKFLHYYCHGYNATNGHYELDEIGTQVCWNYLVFGTFTAGAGGYISAVTTWAFPRAFVDNKYAYTSAGSINNGAGWGSTSLHGDSNFGAAALTTKSGNAYSATQLGLVAHNWYTSATSAQLGITVVVRGRWRT